MKYAFEHQLYNYGLFYISNCQFGEKNVLWWFLTNRRFWRPAFSACGVVIWCHSRMNTNQTKRVYHMEFKYTSWDLLNMNRFCLTVCRSVFLFTDSTYVSIFGCPSDCLYICLLVFCASDHLSISVLPVDVVIQRELWFAGICFELKCIVMLM